MTKGQSVLWVFEFFGSFERGGVGKNLDIQKRAFINTGVKMAGPKQINQGQDRKKGIAQCLKKNKSQSRR